MTDRKAFEAWATTQMDAFSSTRFFNDSCWEAWQASRKQALEEAAVACGGEISIIPATTLIDLSRVQGIRACVDAVERLAKPQGEAS